MTYKGLAIFSLIAGAAFANADYFTAATGLVGTNMRHPDSEVGSDYGFKTSSAIDISASEASSDDAGFDAASSHFQVLAEMGRLHAKVETYGTHGYVGVGNEGIDGGIAFLMPNSADFPQYGGIGGSHFAGGRWEDVLHVQSSTLGFGAEVQFHLHMTLEGTMDVDAPYAGNQTRASLTTDFGNNPLYLALADGSNTLTIDQIVTAHVGDDIQMQSTLDMYAESSYSRSGPSHANIDTWNTGVFSLESLTPGATYTTDSGYRYTPQAVPEPSAIAGLGLGLVAVIRRRKRA